MSPLAYALLADVLASVENARGKHLGITAYLQVQDLMRLLPEDTRPEDLKTLLAPLLCKNKEEQEQFYEIFKTSWARIQETGELEDSDILKVEEEIKQASRWQRVREASIYILLLILVVTCFIVWRNNDPIRTKPTRIPIEMFVGQSGNYSFQLGSPNGVIRSKCPKLDSASAIIRQDSIVKIQESINGVFIYSSNIYYTAIRTGTDSFCIQVLPDVASGSYRSHYTLLFTVKDSLPVPTDTVMEVDSSIYQQHPFPHIRDYSRIDIPQPTRFQQFLWNYKWPLKAMFILLSGLVLWWLAWKLEKKRRRLIAEYRLNLRPPYTWSVELGSEPEIAFGEDFYKLLHRLRRRENDERWKLDMPRTVRATVDKGGMPEFRFARQTRPAEYLLLIDRQNSRDHQARFFDLLYRTFRNQDILVERFWYDEGDPRRCYNEAYPGGLSLSDLQYYHPQSRVLLLGTAYGLLHAETGRLSKWATQTFSVWPDRAVLSTQALGAFGRRERQLQELFQVVPASLSGLHAIVELLDVDEEKSPDLAPRHYPDAALQRVQLLDNDLIKTLLTVATSIRESTPADQHLFLLWVAACALYPELQWDLTLQLGHLLDGATATAAGNEALSGNTFPNRNIPLIEIAQQPVHRIPLLSHASLQVLTRLPWFVEGEMPLEVRQILLAWLEREHSDIHYLLRKGLNDILVKNPPSAESAAYNEYAMNLALNEWLYTRNRNRKKQLQREIAARLAAGQSADFMVLRMLEPDKTLSPEQFEVPADWKKHLREKGQASLHPTRAWWWALPVWLVLCGLSIWWKPTQVECKGALVSYLQKNYCVENGEELAIYREMLLEDMLVQGKKVDADSVWNLMYGQGWRNYMQPLIVLSVLSDASTSMSQNEDLGIDSSQLRKIFSTLLAKCEIAANKPSIDSISFLQNATIAYFNKAVEIRRLSANSTTDFIRDSVIREACKYFSSAQEINMLLPDTSRFNYVQEAALACNSIRPQNSTDNPSGNDDGITIYGSLSDDATQYALSFNTLFGNLNTPGTSIEVRGLQPAIIQRGATFSLKVPGGWNKPLNIRATAFGYEPMNVVVQVADFDKPLSLKFRPRERCYESYRRAGIRLMSAKNYREASGKFALARNCTDKPASGDDLAILQSRLDSIALNTALVAPPSTRSVSVERAPSIDTKSDDDGDGVANWEDQCPTIKGDASNNGCPSLFRYAMKSIDGSTVSLSDYKNVKGLILVFMSPFCPYDELYEGRVIALHNKFAVKGYPVVAINPHNLEFFDNGIDQMKARALNKNYPFKYLIDENHTIADIIKVTNTPTVVVLDQNGEIAYKGPIDNNVENPAGVSQNYVVNALNDLIKGQKPEVGLVRSGGCKIR